MKNVYNLLNDVEIDLSEYELEEVSEFEKKKMMFKFKNSKNKSGYWNKKKVVSVAVAMFMAISLGVHSDKVVAAVDSLKYSINSWLGINTEAEEYSAKIGDSLEIKDTKLTLNEFFADESRIIINVNINKGSNEILENNIKFVPDVYIDDNKIMRNSDYLGYRIESIDENKKECNVILELEMEKFILNNENDVKLVFSNLANECEVEDLDFTYNFIYDSSSYKNASKDIEVNKSINIDDNKLVLDKITITPDRILISGEAKGFGAWENSKDVNYHYDIVNENGDAVPLKEEIGKGAYFYRYRFGEDIPQKEIEVNTLKIIPYTFNEINTNTTSKSFDGRTKYILEDKSVTVNLK